MLDAYRRANQALHPSSSLREKTAAAMAAGRRPRRRWPLYVSAAAAALALAFLLSLMPRPSQENRGSVRALRAYALSEPL